MDSFESDRITRGRAKVTNGNYDRWDIDVRSYLDYEQKQINQQDRLNRQNEQDREDRRNKAFNDKCDLQYENDMRQWELDQIKYQKKVEYEWQVYKDKQLQAEQRLQYKRELEKSNLSRLIGKIKTYRYIFSCDELIISFSNSGHPIPEKKLIEYYSMTSDSDNFGPVSFPERFRDRFRSALESIEARTEHLKTETSISVLQGLLNIEIEKFKQRIPPKNSTSIPVKKWYMEEYLSG
jgi:hypothetical protein